MSPTEYLTCSQYLIGALQNGQGHQKQRESEKLPQPRGAYREMAAKCEILAGILEEKRRTLDKNDENLNKV